VKVVPDTMIWVSYCTLEGSYRHRLIERAYRQRVRFYVSDCILTELVDTLVEDLGRTKRFGNLARRAVLRMAELVEIASPRAKYVPGDPDDDPIIHTALSAKVDYLITGDTEILKVGKVHDVVILTAAQFEALLPPDV
jgi:uncharacterized protein